MKIFIGREDGRMRLGISAFDLWPQTASSSPCSECIGSVTLHLYSICLVNSGGNRREDPISHQLSRAVGKALAACSCPLGRVAASGYNITPEQIGLAKAGRQGRIRRPWASAMSIRDPMVTSLDRPVYRLLAQVTGLSTSTSIPLAGWSRRASGWTTQAIPATTGNSPSDFLQLLLAGLSTTHALARLGGQPATAVRQIPERPWRPIACGQGVYVPGAWAGVPSPVWGWRRMVDSSRALRAE